MIILSLLRRIQGLSHTPQMYQYWSLSEPVLVHLIDQYWFALWPVLVHLIDQYWFALWPVLVNLRSSTGWFYSLRKADSV